LLEKPSKKLANNNL
jgi:hypothetical protein